VFISKRSVNLIVYVLAAAMNFELIDAVVLSAEPQHGNGQVQRVLDGLRYGRKVKLTIRMQSTSTMNAIK